MSAYKQKHQSKSINQQINKKHSLKGEDVPIGPTNCLFGKIKLYQTKRRNLSKTDWPWLCLLGQGHLHRHVAE
jgi:hypothetical protein